MKKSKFTEQQIAFALQQAESGTQVGEVCRKMGISEATFYRWVAGFIAPRLPIFLFRSSPNTGRLHPGRSNSQAW
jgi:transposase-like protein